jgi:hypothetical protein
MSKLGISIRIDVSKIDKEKLFKGKKGTYLNLKTFINPKEFDQYGNNGFITQDIDGVDRPPILGNCKVFFDDEAVASHREGVQNMNNTLNEPAPGFEDEAGECPF